MKQKRKSCYIKMFFGARQTSPTEYSLFYGRFETSFEQGQEVRSPKGDLSRVRNLGGILQQNDLGLTIFGNNRWLITPNINEIIDIIENWKIQWNLNPEIVEVAEIERKELVKSNDWILFDNYKNPEAFYFSKDLNF
ncbi:hypothetical protein RhiirC2_794431 [Rhizophagus irregularis]|uniref:Uncharacterized protein n=1 Tax=Rhizophagus irregularis TaxID=588596 RepID=A0A2N1MDL0_9GLOM|nr:hypothetical protein RhiirC2_794431 [Rhizophagus irregularis]